MNDKLRALIILAVKQAGTYDPDDALTYVEEQLNDAEYTLASTFLRWVFVNDKTFGPVNIDVVFKEFKKAGHA